MSSRPQGRKTRSNTVIIESVVWNESEFGTGIENVDKEHQKLFGMINNLLEISSKTSSDVIAKTAGSLDQLRDYTISHLAHEEKLFQLTHYPKIEQHIAAHAEFREKISHIISEYQHARKLPPDTISYLVTWLSNHIKAMDLECVCSIFSFLSFIFDPFFGLKDPFLIYFLPF